MKKLDLVKTLLLSCEGWITIEDLLKVILKISFYFKNKNKISILDLS